MNCFPWHATSIFLSTFSANFSSPPQINLSNGSHFGMAFFVQQGRVQAILYDHLNMKKHTKFEMYRFRNIFRNLDAGHLFNSHRLKETKRARVKTDNCAKSILPGFWLVDFHGN